MFTIDIKSVKHFSEEERRIIQRAAGDVWNEIGADYLQAVGEGAENGFPESATVPRSHVIEAVCDANRLDDMIRRSGRRTAIRDGDDEKIAADKQLCEELIGKLGRTDYATIKRLVRPAFEFDRYGF